MSLRILSFFIEGVTWRVAKTPAGYCHRNLSNLPEWIPGIPSGVAEDIVENTFRQFADEDGSLQPHHLTFKMTYRVGHSNIEWFIFSSPDGDLFSVKIPPATFSSLHDAFPSENIPRMRIARLAIQQAIALGLPGIELTPGNQVYETVKSQLSASSVQKVKA